MLALSRLKNDAHIDFHKSIYDSLAGQKDLNPTICKLLKKYKAAIEHETEACSRNYRSDIVAQMHKAEERRDEAFLHLRAMVKFLKYKKDAATQEAFAMLSKLCKSDYSSQITKLDKRTKLTRMQCFANLLHENARFMNDFSDFQHTLQVLDEANADCERLMGLRTTELSEFKKGLTLAARAEADRLYRLIVTTLKNERELQETLDETPAEADRDSIINIEKREKETRRYLRVTETWRNKRREKLSPFHTTRDIADEEAQENLTIIPLKNFNYSQTYRYFRTFAN